MRSKSPTKPEESVAPFTKKRAPAATERREKRLREEEAREHVHAFADALNRATKKKSIGIQSGEDCLAKKKVLSVELKPTEATEDMTTYKLPGNNLSQTRKEAAKLRHKASPISQAKELSEQTSQSSSQASSKPSQSTPSSSQKVSRYQASEEEQRQFASNYGSELVITMSPSRPSKR